MKLIIQIPCHNEEATLPQTLADLPKQIPGIDSIEIQIVDDGSSDETVAVARAYGVHHILSFKRRKGLAAAFRAGVNHALQAGADILVNTDGDNQYQGRCIPSIVAPILSGEADLVLGARPIESNPDFSWPKKKLQRLGSWFLRRVSGIEVVDAATGFRAYSRHALISLNIYSDFSYTMETLIQAGYENLKFASVPIQVNRATRKSRLFRSMSHYIFQSLRTVMNVSLIYRGSRIFSAIGTVYFVLSAIVGIYFVVSARLPFSNRDVIVFITAIGCAILGTVNYVTGIISMLFASNRKLSEDTLCRLRQQDSLNRENVTPKLNKVA